MVDGNQIRMIGGETAGASGFSGCWIDRVSFGHHPDLYLTGTISGGAAARYVWPGGRRGDEPSDLRLLEKQVAAV